MSLRGIERSGVLGLHGKNRLPECLYVCYSPNHCGLSDATFLCALTVKADLHNHRASAIRVSAPVDFSRICTLLLHYADSIAKGALRCAVHRVIRYTGLR